MPKSGGKLNALVRFPHNAALTVQTKEADPAAWAETQYNFGVAWLYMPTGDKKENLRKAMDCLTAALFVWTKEADPNKWAMVHTKLGD